MGTCLCLPCRCAKHCCECICEPVKACCQCIFAPCICACRCITAPCRCCCQCFNSCWQAIWPCLCCFCVWIGCCMDKEEKENDDVEIVQGKVVGTGAVNPAEEAKAEAPAATNVDVV
uniref:Uncharacterized protein n=1 Tax=Lotharella oceanica TaxID=641309 RepID=A0A7S2U395_9EUKA|mmetsp:Transcript_7717/g.15083  ORF Transcript_7717/g.15083 Transcript_7717/m.15083 type:complete len:117 (+) Transcript_7717:86-436(+)